jgi:hypothetical protein
MKSEKLQKWASISEIIGGFAVLLTLVILILEVRDNTQIMRATAYDSIVADMANARYENARNEAAQEVLFALRMDGYDALTPEQVLLFGELNLALFQIYERAFIQWESGNLDQYAWLRFKRIICEATNAPGFNERIGDRLDRLTTESFTQYRNTQC